MTDTVKLIPGADYVLVVPAAKTWFMLSSDKSAPIRLVRTVADATAPDESLRGHPIQENSGATRALFPDGAIWAKVKGGLEGYLAVDYNA